MYQIQINEDQRVILQTALAELVQTTHAPSEELALLVGMVHDLPKVEAASPGTLHCFNL